jgi:hypothetical protein
MPVQDVPARIVMPPVLGDGPAGYTSLFRGQSWTQSPAPASDRTPAPCSESAIANKPYSFCSVMPGTAIPKPKNFCNWFFPTRAHRMVLLTVSVRRSTWLTDADGFGIEVRACVFSRWSYDSGHALHLSLGIEEDSETGPHRSQISDMLQEWPFICCSITWASSSPEVSLWGSSFPIK